MIHILYDTVTLSLYSLRGKMSYCQISWRLEGVGLDAIMIVVVWIWQVPLIFQSDWESLTRISRLRDWLETNLACCNCGLLYFEITDKSSSTSTWDISVLENKNCMWKTSAALNHIWKKMNKILKILKAHLLMKFVSWKLVLLMQWYHRVFLLFQEPKLLLKLAYPSRP